MRDKVIYVYNCVSQITFAC